VEVDMTLPIQDEPESTVGRKPPVPPDPRRESREDDDREIRSGAGTRLEDAHEGDAGEASDRGRDEPPVTRRSEE
jgi:hypothetical protein